MVFCSREGFLFLEASIRVFVDSVEIRKGIIVELMKGDRVLLAWPSNRVSASLTHGYKFGRNLYTVDYNTHPLDKIYSNFIDALPVVSYFD
ncbi:transmembrane protein, putative [Medicago truncatula]|uniref:Transmembrane protein, putative n=2 Tax=Medicago truncatula TaxID=3880 RepID=G7K7C6_MEDTR|nr:transmembrane protein, putative [Medicago truncatula]